MVDYRKAFDHIDHGTILRKLENLGVHECLVKWVHAFLCDRQMKVCIDKHDSDWLSPNGGVPQGTKLGPLLFIVLINDLTPPVPTTKFVDDTTISECFTNPVESKLQTATDHILDWSSSNSMQLNAAKTKEMLVCFKRNPETIPSIVIDGQEIERVDDAKLLGVHISSNLSWNTHINAICSKAGQRVYVLYRLKHSGLHPNEIISVFISFVRPVLEYACQVWHTCINQEQTKKLESYQKRACKIAAPHLTYLDALHHFKLTKLSERREIMCEKYFNSLLEPKHKLHHLLPVPKSSHHNLRKSSTLPIPRARTERYKRSFLPYALSHYQQ